MASYGDFQDGGCPPFVFYEYVAGQFAPLRQFSRRPVDPLLRYGDFYIFIMAAVRQLEIIKNSKFCR